MKNKRFKKALSVFLSVLMLMSAWVWVAPTDAAAATSVGVTTSFTLSPNGNRGSTDWTRLALTGEGSDGGTSIVVIKFSSADVQTLADFNDIRLKFYSYSCPLRIGTAQADVYAVTANQSYIDTVSGTSQNATDTGNTILGTTYTGTAVQESVKAYFGLGDSLGTFTQPAIDGQNTTSNRTGTANCSFEVTDLVKSKAESGEDLSFVIMLQSAYSCSASVGWSDTYINSDTIVLSEYSAADEAASLKTAIDSFETKLANGSSRFYKDITNAYDTYNNAKRYYDAVVYGGVTYDATIAQNYITALSSALSTYNDTYIDYLNQTFYSRNGTAINQAYTRNLIWNGYDFSWDITTSTAKWSRSEVENHWAIPNTIIGITDDRSATFPVTTFFFTGSSIRYMRYIVAGSGTDSSGNVVGTSVFSPATWKVASSTHTTSNWAAGTDGWGDWYYDSDVNSTTIPAYETSNYTFQLATNTVYQASTYMTANNSTIGVSASNLSNTTDFGMSWGVAWETTSSGTNYATGYASNTGFGYVHAVYMEPYRVNYNNWSSIIPSFSYKNYNGYAYNSATAIATNLDSASSSNVNLPWVESQRTGDISSTVSEWATKINNGANHLANAKTNANSATKITTKYTDLTAAISAADSIYNKGSKHYTPATWEAFENAYNDARDHMAKLDPNGTGNQYSDDATTVGALATALTDAQAALQYVTVTFVDYAGTVKLTLSAENNEVYIGTTKEELAAFAPENTALTKEAGKHTVYSWPVFADVTDSKEYKEVATDSAHSWSEWTTTKEATCSEEGVQSRTCTLAECGYVATETISKVAHTSAEAVKENEVAATCDTPGSYDMVVYCSECDTEISKETSYTNATGHSWDEGTVITAATCTTDGTKLYTCTVCDETKNEVINRTGHKDEDKDHVCDNGCSEYQGTHSDAADDSDHVCDYGCGVSLESCADNNKDHNCDICGTELSAHSWTDATCEAPKTCSICGTTEGEKLEHDYTDVAATQETGNATQHYYICKTCNTEKLYENHDFSYVTTEPTYEAAGSKVGTCSACGYVSTEVLTQLVDTNAPVITFNGSGNTDTFCKTVTVTIEDERAVTLSITKDGAEYPSVAALAEAESTSFSLVEAGEYVITATDASDNVATKTVTVNADHTVDSWTKADENNHSGICTVCGETVTEAHTYENPVLTRPTLVDGAWTDGVYTSTCVCGDTSTENAARADYSEFNEALANLESYAERDDLTDAVKAQIRQIADGVKDGTYEMDLDGDGINDMRLDYVADEQAKVDALTTAINNAIVELDSGIENGTLIKPDFTAALAEWEEYLALVEQYGGEVSYGTEGDSTTAAVTDDGYIKDATNTEVTNGLNYLLENVYNNSSANADTYQGDIDKMTTDLAAINDGIRSGTLRDPNFEAYDAEVKIYNEDTSTVNVSAEDAEAVADAKSTVEAIRANADATAADSDATIEAQAAIIKAVNEKYAACIAGTHDYADATCTEAKTCKLCGETDGEATGHSWGTGVLTRPSETDGTWTDGYYTYTCATCGETKTEAAARANYTAYDKAVEDLNKLLNDDTLTEAAKTEIENALTDGAVADNLITTEQTQVDTAAAALGAVLDTITNDTTGAYEKPDYTNYNNAVSAYEALDSVMAAEDKAAVEAIKAEVAKIPADASKAACQADIEKAATAIAEINAKYGGCADGNHSWNDGTVESEPTCSAEGSKLFTCSVCGTTKTESIGTVDHKYETYVNNNDATCQKNATETAKCVYGCGTEDTRDVENSTVSHKYTNYGSDNNADCEKDGTKTAYCDYGCGSTDTVTDEGTAKVHSWGEGVLTRPAETDGTWADGYYTYTCANNSEHKKTEKAARANYTAYDKAVEDLNKLLGDTTLTDAAKAEIETALTDNAVADNLIATEQPQVDSAATVLGSVLDRIANDTTGAYEKPDYTGAEEAIKDAEKVPGLSDEDKAALEELKKELQEIKDKKNPDANAKDDQDDVDAIENAVNDIIDNYDSCNHVGTSKRVISNLDGTHSLQCVVCDETVETASCTYTESVVEATCQSVGYTLHVCKVCEYSYRDNENGPLEHNWSRWYINEGTCKEASTQTRYCDNIDCFAQETVVCTDENGNKIYGPHTLVIVDGKPATCTKDGYSDYSRCIICDEVTESTVIPATGHADNNNNGNCDVCNYLMNPSGDCGCFCHNDSFFGKLLFKFVNFFWKLFKINSNCECGEVHW